MVLPRLAPCLLCFQRAGLGPPADLLFLLRQDKEAKEGDPSACVPFALLRGNLCHPAHKADAAKLAARLQRAAQTVATSQSTKHPCPSAQTPALWAGCHRRRHKGECGDREPGPCGCCVAFAGSIDFIAARTRIQGSRGIKHSNFQSVTTLPGRPLPPFWLRLRHALQTAAKAAAGQPWLRHLAGGKCLSGACKARATSFCRTAD